MTEPKKHVGIDYTNHRGERQLRAIEPGTLQFGSSAWHPEEQWLLHSFDIGKGAVRTFAMASIHGWFPPDSRTARVDISIAKQLQASIERNGRTSERLKKLAERLHREVNPEVRDIAVDLDSIRIDQDPS